MNKLPIRHHYLPQFYQRYFTDEKGLLWEFDRGSKAYTQKSSKGTGYLKNYYSFKGTDGKDHTEIENFFGFIEDKAKRVIDKLNDSEELTKEDREVLATFIGFQMTRVPNFQKTIDESSEKLLKRSAKLHYSSLDEVKEIIEETRNKSGIDNNESPEKLFELIQNENYRIKMPREDSIKSMLKLGYDFGELFLKMDWTLFYSSAETSFITSDNPFYITPPPYYDEKNSHSRGYGIETPGTIKAMPLSSKVLIAMHDVKETIPKVREIKLDKKTVRGINCDIALCSDQYIIARDKKHLEGIIKITKVDEFMRETRVEIR